MGLQINFTLDELTPDTARALVALVADAFPDAVRSLGHVETVSLRVDTSQVTEALAEPAAKSGPSPAFTPPAEPVPFTAGAVPAPPTAPDASPAVASGQPPERDAAGLPWDARIHASTKALNADGTWRGRRAVHEDTRRLVEAELRQNMAAPVVSVPVPPQAAPSVPPPPPAMSDSVTPASDVSPVQPVSSTSQSVDVPPPPPADAPALSGPQLFANLMRKTTAAQTAGKLSSADVAAVATGLGLASTAALMTRPDLIPAAEAQIDALIAAAG